ncbi:23S rRNA (adenine(2503)-C(2))-methyltransferase RlmN [Pontibacillus yanchengensis]|uniref:23S rRNA (Adenine(2503)-C(2))-methyltransferase RlmN n=3 Tax=Pontibacillus yanchengensis TaxID=462910 RepID=A0ACC7VB18_9BACI|nr:23S rRNA (adenine(2503)-C(2))-methyltransferase RlmN [Pontibacillus yanchengensis]MYL52058.1 23S rRNA (adenine(2503)-C(2))-methyltransferase RlmN [Pontibacillus yanchengensis]
MAEVMKKKRNKDTRPNLGNSIYSLTHEELQTWLENHGEPKFRATQIFEWLYQKRVEYFEEMTNLSKGLRDKLNESFTITTLETVVQQKSQDGRTMKFLFEMNDGYTIETVLMKHDYGYSVCVTSQVGCRIGCTFCASSIGGLKRQLESGEIVSQVIKVQKALDEQGERVSSIVLMGIGEPFDNYEEIIAFLRTINHNKGINIGARHITLSTSGIVPRIYDFADEKTQVNFAVSLHAVTNERRSKLMPINKAYPLEKLLPSVKYYNETTGRRVTFEYGLLGGENDSPDEARALAKVIRDYNLNIHVNLIPVNFVPERDYVRTPRSQIFEFERTLKEEGINVTIRREQGHDIDAACGQLRAKERKKETR